MVEELSITELDTVSGGAKNSINWGDETWGALEMAGGLVIMATSEVDGPAGIIGGAYVYAAGARRFVLD
ncbi:hypothetical protein HF289_09625 [Acidithiobacillus ferrooxidans]|jgi:hypothetical protein|uniref:hypothetical protein n=1 Tax=Acidithiobacillus TaxID=119977 RepID=UPI0013D52A5C|nr:MULTISPECIES: hypothetical protein [Acidithiobacillus]MBU2857117.1 hypothetical protein [Acidithiobacillus ferrooxidans]MBU2861150.1 hypothetical protein [Acidithiobacillus ferrooxidans]MCR2828725.1 hypothetical protein [Acidithiobacillus ferrooxidans]